MKKLDRTSSSPISNLLFKLSIISYSTQPLLTLLVAAFFYHISSSKQATAQTKDSLVDLSKDNFCDDLKEKKIKGELDELE